MTPGRMVIDNRFELIERLGSGGMGTVWRAHDLALHRDVALKEVRPSGPMEEDPGRARMLRERVLREARALARLDHPNVVTIHHIVDATEMAHPWIVMELVRGRSLQDRLAQGPLAPAEAAHLGRGILAALHTAHMAGICHRDVKPANVLLRADGSPVLTDFGIAALHDAPGLTANGDLVGSPEYIAPERLRGQEGNPASDLWSLGMLLYVAVEGSHPMRRPTVMATLAAVLNGQVPPPHRAGPLANVLRALLTQDPAARPSAAELDRMLSQAAGQTPDTQPPFPLPVPRRGSRRLRAVTIAGAVTLSVVLTTLVLLPNLRNDPEDKVTPEVSHSSGGLAINSVTPGVEPTAKHSTEPTAEPTAEHTGSGTLLTPSRIMEVIKAMEAAAGSTKFIRFTVYDEHASADALVPGRKDVYDTFTYRDGQVSRRNGSILMPGQREVRLRSFNWNALPALRRIADRKLGITDPSMRYVILEGSWTFANNQPVLLVYLIDDHMATGYLAANLKGKVLTMMPWGN
ncbi:serine/threonine protein kinase [Streptosporangium sp. NBC_01639]|uniref:serine/threonine-protein kinase n=1 Tax=Streptosporangium sp. NBC_01639 TaxID=2975948 RepID=UPI00386C2F78|nr:serine/threonine protein kinase [Streptosporangium sp. NBC_01639]